MMPFIVDYYFEKLHRYVYDYHFQSKNEDFGRPSQWMKKNARRGWRVYLNKPSYWLYSAVSYFMGNWRSRLAGKEVNYTRYK